MVLHNFHCISNWISILSNEISSLQFVIVFDNSINISQVFHNL